MLRATVLGLGVGTLCATLAAIGGAQPIELPEPAPRPRFLALGGELLELAAETGPGCFAPMLDELRRHPRWSIRIDDLEWDDVVDDEPDPRRASIVLDAAAGTWRDGWLPQSLSLADDERRALWAAFALDCRVDPEQPRPGFVGRYFTVALGEDGTAVARFRTNSFVALRLGALFDQIRARYVAGRAADVHGLSLELAGVRRTGRDDLGRSEYEPYRLDLRDFDQATHNTLEDRVRLLDWAMTLPAALPAGKQVVRGTLRAHGTSRPIALDLRADLYHWGHHALMSELSMWASINREPID
ncbi:MAG TPA: hypothetical protein VNO30_27955 [Kofleriaceae bacterium]|nr:hypothetical protein [Kofleriaceae bacterium]